MLNQGLHRGPVSWGGNEEGSCCLGMTSWADPQLPTSEVIRRPVLSTFLALKPWLRDSAGHCLTGAGNERKEFELGMKEVSTIFPGVSTTFITLRNQAQHIQGN